MLLGLHIKIDNVSSDNVEAVIKSVLDNLTNLKVDCLPKSTFARLMFAESRRLSQLQIAESLISDYEKSCNSLQSDGTSKFGKHYETYHVVTGKGQYLTTGIREVSSGNTQTQLNVLIDIFKELEESLNKKKSVTK